MGGRSRGNERTRPEKFRGRITYSHGAHAEFLGKPPVLIPETADDVGPALALVREGGLGLRVRSGDRVTRNNLETSAADAVVSLEALATIDIDLQRISVGPAATVGDLATALRHRALFVPLPDQPTVSLAAAVLGHERPQFPKSVGKNRPLWKGVIEAQVVPADGGVGKTLDKRGWAAFRKNPKLGVVTRLVLDASVWAAWGGNRWVRAWMVPYSRQTFEVLCDGLFVRSAPTRVDLSLRASTGAYGVRMLVVRATGQGRDRSESTRRIVENSLKKAKCSVLWSEKVDGAGASIAAWVGTGPGRVTAGEVHDEQADDALWSGSGNEVAYLDEVDRRIDAGSWVDLHKGSLFRRAFIPDSVGVGAVIVPPLGPVAPSLAATHEGGTLIPGFTGEVFQRKANDRAYRVAIQQYAVSSYDAATVDKRMTPSVVAVAKNGADVGLAVAWAATQGFKVVARSGGHQYCGLSSGGLDTVLIDVKLLNEVDFVTTPGLPPTATVGPGVPLDKLTAAMVARGASIPHGECPLVNLGGHVQTGGVGHQLRGLGVALDWVRAFDMVVATGAKTTFTRPIPGAPPVPQDDVFAAVLGGGPGSWGVLTAITFDLAMDDAAAYTKSSGYTKTYMYNRAAWAAGFEQMRLWSDMQTANTLPAGADLFLSVISSDFELNPHANLRPAVVLIETSALDATGDAAIQSVVAAVEAKVSWFHEATGKVIDLAGRSPNGPTPLSVIVDHGVRSTSALGGMPGGREFTLPYKKSLYVTTRPLPAAFCDGFVDLVDLANRRSGIKVVFQGVVGGGRFQKNAGPTTRMQRRDALVQIVFDVFYEEGQAFIAEDFQAQMRALWTKYLPSETGRMFWGTYEDPGTNGAQLDMGNVATQNMYYDSPAVYAALQQVKAAIDPGAVFATKFTVR